MDWKAWVLAVATAGVGCGDDAASGDSAVGTSATTSPGASQTDSSPSADTASSDASDASDASDTSDDGTLPPPPDPATAPGSCGWSGEAYACGWAASEAHVCAAGAMAGALCEAGDTPCCLDGATLLRCDCLDNACDYVWYAADCTHGPGAGACGWVEGGYQCGGDGADPAGTPIECPSDVSEGVCDVDLAGTTCCTPEGDAVECSTFGGNGGANWVVTDCTFD